MADKTQNIIINYKFNTLEVDKANTVLNRANQATNQLQAAGQKAGQSLSQSYGKVGTSIEAMNIQLARLKTQISVSSDPKRVAELSNQYKALKTEIDKASAAAFKLPKALNETKAATQGLAQQFGGLYNAARLLVTAGIAREAVDITLAMATLKGNVEGVERAFDRAFPNSIKLLSELRAATHGAVTDFELMQRTLQATNLGVAVESLPILFEFAAARAQQTGESVDYLVDSIVRGIGRKSILVLDNLGLSATRLKEQFDGAALASQSVADVTRGVAEIAREELEKMGGYAENTKTQVDQLKVAVEQLRITLAKKAETGGLISFLTESARGLEMLAKGNRNLAIEEARRVASEDAARIMESKSFKELGDDRQKQFDLIQQEINSRVQLIGRYNDNIAGLENEREVIRDNNPYDKRIDVLNKSILAYKNNKFVIASTILTLKDYLKEIEKLNAAESENTNKPVEQSGIVQRKKKEIEALQEAIQKTNNLSDLGIGGNLTKQLEIAQAELADLLRAFTDFKIEPFKLEIGDATKDIGALSQAMDGATDRIEESLKKLAETKLPPLTGASLGYTDTFWDELGDEFKENWGEIVSEVTDIIANNLISTREIELQSMKLRLKDIKDFYNGQIELAGDNEKAKQLLRKREEKETAELNRKIFEKEKQTRRSQALIDGAAGVVKAFASYPYPAALVISALIAAGTLSQINIINKQRSGYAKGVIDLQGPGTGTSDSIPVNLSRGESVMTAWETRHSGDVLKDIRAKKLDNKVLKSLKEGRQPIQSQQFDDSKIIKAIQKNRPADIVKEGNIIYEVRQQGDDYRNKVRAKSIRI